MKKTLYAIDVMYFDKVEKNLCGDMGYTFQEEPDTRTEDVDELVEGIKNSATDYMLDMEWDDVEVRAESDIPVHAVFSADYTDEVDEDDDFCNWGADKDADTIKYHTIFIYASKEEAEMLGMIPILDETYGTDAPRIFFDPDVELSK